MNRKQPQLEDFPHLDLAHALFVIEYCKDNDARRAASVAGYPADEGYKLRDDPYIREAIQSVIVLQLKDKVLDPEWLLQELYHNHLLARQQGNITASNQTLNLIAKHAKVNAFAAEKVEMIGDKEIMMRLTRERERNLARIRKENSPSFL